MPLSFETKFCMTQQELEALPRPKLDEEGKNLSRIAEFYHGRSVFLTGATGFVGRLLLEKLLRACPTIRRVFILVRAKANKTIEERLIELTSSHVFDGLRHLGIDLAHKIVPIEGDLTKRVCFGLSSSTLSLLANEVSVIIHSAASVNFTEPIRDATLTNVVGTLNSIDLAMRLPNLAALVYVSTAYSNCIRGPEIWERVYESQTDPMMLIYMAELMARDDMQLVKEHLVGHYPNTYTYTKNLAEMLCFNNAHRLPIVICRPSVVIATWREPLLGFTDNINGGNGLNYGQATGLLAVIEADDESVLDYVPVDVVINCVIALGWFCAKFHTLKRNGFKPVYNEIIRSSLDAMKERDEEELASKMKHFYERRLNEFKLSQMPEQQANIPVFHITSIMDNSITLGDFKDKLVALTSKYPTSQLYRRPNTIYVNSHRAYLIARFFMNTLPSKLFDFLNRWDTLKPKPYDNEDPMNEKSLAFRTQRLDYFCQTIAYFLKREWRFRPDNRRALIDDFMTSEDRRLFNCDMRNLNWNEYCKIYTIGIRKYLLREPDETIESARKRLNVISTRNFTIQIALFCIAMYFIISWMLM